MAGSDSEESQGSANSHASAYTAVSVRADENNVYVQPANASVPDYAPQLPSNATHAVFDVEAQTFHAVVPSSKGGSRVMQAAYNGATGGWEWAKHHNKALAKAFVDSVPTIFQTAADSMDPGYR